MDPLIAAMIGKLPEPGKPFPDEQRSAWLTMMQMAFGVAYGPADNVLAFPHRHNGPYNEPFTVDTRVPVRITEAAPAGPPARQPHAGHTFYIDAGGNVLRGEGEAVFARDIPPEEVIFDYRQVAVGEFRDLESVTWADGSKGIAGLPAGISFCGPGSASSG